MTKYVLAEHGGSNLDKAIKRSCILVVDDMALMRRIIIMVLKRAGYTNILEAEDGDDALAIIHESLPDLVILDIKMPRMDGYEVCRQLRGDSKTKRLPILVQSASETPQERVKVFEVGATDFVSKPINQRELTARVNMHLENKILISNLSSFERHIRSELLLAREMQESLLPSNRKIKQYQKTYSLDIDFKYKASFELGGDLWGCWPVNEDELGIFVLDMTGHGVGSALNTFRSHAVMEQLMECRSDPGEFLAQLNDTLKGGLSPGQFATMFYGVLNTRKDEIRFSGAGSPRPFLISDSGIRILDSSGVPIGVLKNAVYSNQTIEFKLGDTLFCYSDVLVEAEQANGSCLGEEGLVKIVKTQIEKTGKFDIRSLLNEPFFRSALKVLPDDLTAVSIMRTGPV